MIIFAIIYLHLIHAFNNILPHKPRLFHSSTNNTGLDCRFPQEEHDFETLLKIKENLLRKSLLHTLKNKNISDEYKLSQIKYFDLLFNTSVYVGNLYAGGLLLEYDDFRFD
jgi:hypothetical protein